MEKGEKDQITNVQNIFSSRHREEMTYGQVESGQLFLIKTEVIRAYKDYEKWKLFNKLHHLLIKFIRNFYTLIKRYREWLWITKISDLLSVTINDLKVDVGIS